LFPEFDEKSLNENELSCGQPALLSKLNYSCQSRKFILFWKLSQFGERSTRVEPVSSGVSIAEMFLMKFKFR